MADATPAQAENLPPNTLTGNEGPYKIPAHYQADLYSERYANDKAFRAAVNKRLEASPNIMSGSNDSKVRQTWLERDGAKIVKGDK